MERKTIRTKKETSIIKKQENKTEVSDSGRIRTTKSEILTEYLIIETQLALDNVDASRSTAESENFPELIKTKVTEKEVLSMPSLPEDDFNTTSDYCNVSDRKESFTNRNELVHSVSGGLGETLDPVKCTDYVSLTGSDRYYGNAINTKESNPPRELSSNINGSFTCATAQSRPFSQYENETVVKERDCTSKDCNNPLLDNKNAAKYISPKVLTLPFPDSDLNEVEMSKMNSLSNNLATHFSQNNDQIVKCKSDTEDNLIIVKMGKTAAHKDSLRENDRYDKGDSYLISSGCKEQNKENEVILDREGLDRSVSYLVNFFENIKNGTTSKTDISEEILTSKGKQSGNAGIGVNKTDKYLSSESKNSFQFRRDSNEVNGKLKMPHIKLKMSVCRADDKDLKPYDKITEFKAPDIAKPEVTSNRSNVSNGFCVLKYKKPETSDENLKHNIKELEQYRFLPSDDDVKYEPNNIVNSSEHSFISPRYACKRVRPHFFRQVLSRVESQMPQENDEVNATCCPNVATNGNQVGKRTIKKEIDNKNPRELGNKSFVFLTPKIDNGTGKENMSVKTDGHKSRINKRIVNVSKESDGSCGYYSTEWTFSDKMCFSFALIFSILLAFYKYSYNA